MDDEAYLKDWAKELANSVFEHELRSLVEEFQRIARDTDVPKEDRSIARKRAKALRKYVK